MSAANSGHSSSGAGGAERSVGGSRAGQLRGRSGAPTGNTNLHLPMEFSYGLALELTNGRRSLFLKLDFYIAGRSSC